MSGGLTDALRDDLRAFADVLIPEAHGMPAASTVGVADGQLDRVLGARPDLLEPLVRALRIADRTDHRGSLARLAEQDREAHDALLLTVVGGYYIDRDVRARLGYDGQEPVEVRPEIIPNYVEEGLMEPLLARGPVYREVPNGTRLTKRSSITDDQAGERREMATDDHGTGRR